MSVGGGPVSPELQVRIAGGDRAGAFAELHRSAFDRPWTSSELQRLIDGPCAFALEAAPSAKDERLMDPLGFIVVRAVAGEAEILTLAVHPRARRQAIGRSLVEAAAATAETFGAEAFWLEVAVDNTAAIALYAAAGFQTAGRRPGYYARAGGDRVDALVMRRLLNRAAG
jgi:ribosomal-protein-alanine N-acetyltransferase